MATDPNWTPEQALEEWNRLQSLQDQAEQEYEQKAAPLNAEHEEKMAPLKAARDEKLSPIETDLADLESWFLARSEQDGSEEYKSEIGSVTISTREKAKIDDSESFFDWVESTNNSELLQKRLSVTKLRTYLKENNGEVPPGVAMETERSGSPDALKCVASSIKDACNLSGFFYVKNHGIASADLQHILRVTRTFFSESDDIKKAIAIDQNNRGYLGFGEARMNGAKRSDLKEVFFFGREVAADDADLAASLPLVGMNQWPAAPPDFKSDVLAYLNAVQRTGDALLRAFSVALDRENSFFVSHYTRPMSRGQLIHYPPLRSDAPDDQFSVAAHSDFGCITLLLQELPGLEALNRHGEWMPVPPKPDTLVVNIGDLLQRWTNGALISTQHRVRNTNNEDRYSVAIFHDPNSSAIVDPRDLSDSMSENISDNQAYPPITAGQYILNKSQQVFAQFNET